MAEAAVPSASYDVVIIGGGPGGYNAAIRAGQLGLTAACIEMRETLGGTCLNVGCMPSKALLHASELYEIAGKGFAGLGIEVTPKLNLAQMMGQKTESVTALTKGIEFLFKKNKVDWVRGRGRIAGPGKVEVTAADGTVSTLSAKDIVIATGSEPTPLPGVAFEDGRVVDSTGALSLPAVPNHLIVVGAGIIGLELGSVWRRLGAQVTVVEYLDRITPGMDSDVAKAFQRTLTKQGMAFKLGSKVTGANPSKDGVELTVEPAAGGAPETLKGDVVLVAIGRRPYTDGLGLETVGITPDKRGFIDHDHFKVAEGVWVIGDVTHGPMLAHKAEEDSVAVIELIAGKAGHVDYNLVPSVVYTAPEVAWVGKTEDQLKEAGVAYKVGKFPFTANSRAKINHETDGFAKVLADAATDRILGVHIMGPQAGEMIGEACVAMAFGGSSEDIARICHPHPTRSEAVKQAAMGVEGWTMQA
ncbi:MAG: dihydrolipoyl dehydrogenase [Alphaproteobacteria bacterium]|jgi:dihydrolipoamide dehydrogenase|nr:dihydrolipoyl dehydrogenase [Alphaproteobacteria bacterium]MBU2041505.1 dihydrolipoyl dehydrogenase [Alphaproteobacteria bacterium]MBU2124815.1 dihydrolipoyl dehydrogenase [Alphaproteobacteria bacterium]MBU2291988.1 dihydrolipoyl dehydrogenase [Alphaproteobacteria bacterium]MBU2396581.1 dihydrolipoyl dehydrogenase [Alphaproteobacteria bacterium]